MHTQFYARREKTGMQFPAGTGTLGLRKTVFNNDPTDAVAKALSILNANKSERPDPHNCGKGMLRMCSTRRKM